MKAHSDATAEVTTALQKLDVSQINRTKPFAFMKLPAELRLMVVEHAMSDIQDLVWHWKCEIPGQRVGCFVTKGSVKSWKYGQYQLTRLHPSRQLRMEMTALKHKHITLHFDGVDNAPGPLIPDEKYASYPAPHY